jgi:hypothetical protein
LNRISAAVLLIVFAACAKETVVAEKEAPAPPPTVVVRELRAVTDADTDVAAGNATVADVTELASVASQRAAVIAQRDQAAAKLRASQAELERLRALNADNHNVSDRAVQDAAATAATDAASVQSANAALLAIDAAARQRWGVVLSVAPQLASRDRVLLEVAFTADVSPPARIRITGASGRAIVASYLAAAPRVDARLQKPIFDYIAPAADLPIGLVTVVRARVASSGVLVPKSAVVWNGAEAVVFVEDRPGHYEPHAVSTRIAVDDGFVDASLQPGTRVVVSGAQQLLSAANKPEGE